MGWSTLSETEDRPDMKIWSRAALDDVCHREKLRENHSTYKPRGLDGPEADKMAKLYREGVSIKALQRIFHRSHVTIRLTLEDRCILRSKPKRRTGE